MGYSPSGYIIFSLRKLKLCGFRGPGAESRGLDIRAGSQGPDNPKTQISIAKASMLFFKNRVFDILDTVNTCSNPILPERANLRSTEIINWYERKKKFSIFVFDINETLPNYLILSGINERVIRFHPLKWFWQKQAPEVFFKKMFLKISQIHRKTPASESFNIQHILQSLNFFEQKLGY